MSLINQVLIDLEKRGAGDAGGDPAIRPAAVQAKDRKGVYLLAGVLMALALAGWGWKHHQTGLADQIVSVPRVSTQTDSSSDTIAVQGVETPVFHLSTKLSAIPFSADLSVKGHKNVAASQGKAGEASNQPVKLQQSESAGAVSVERAGVAPGEPHPGVFQTAPPVVTGVSPEPVITRGAALTFTLHGSHFARGATVTLHAPKGATFANRRVVSRSDNQLVIKPNFGSMPGTWSAEVINPGNVISAPLGFTVQTPQSEGSSQTGNAPALSSAPPPEKAVPVTPLAPIASSLGSVDKQIRQLSVRQQADIEYRKANVSMQQGRNGEAIAGYETALKLEAGHDAARQALVGLLLENKRNADAESILQQGLANNPKQSGFAMLLARLQVDRGALAQALETLQRTLPYAGQQADYHAFIAAVQQRMGLHKEAVAHYQIALQSSPDSGIWLMGEGISLKAILRNEEARAAFKHALDTHSLNADLQSFVTQQLKEL